MRRRGRGPPGAGGERPRRQGAPGGAVDRPEHRASPCSARSTLDPAQSRLIRSPTKARPRPRPMRTSPLPRGRTCRTGSSAVAVPPGGAAGTGSAASCDGSGATVASGPSGSAWAPSTAVRVRGRVRVVLRFHAARPPAAPAAPAPRPPGSRPGGRGVGLGRVHTRHGPRHRGPRAVPGRGPVPSARAERSQGADAPQTHTPRAAPASRSRPAVIRPKPSPRAVREADLRPLKPARRPPGLPAAAEA